jgi:hypothetical protein
MDTIQVFFCQCSAKTQDDISFLHFAQNLTSDTLSSNILFLSLYYKLCGY